MLIAPQASLTYRHPAAEGVPVLLPYRRTWYPDPQWECHGVDYIAPLNAFAPTGNIQARDMTADEWPALISYSSAYSHITVPGAPPALWIAHHDGAAYPFGTPETTYATRFATADEYGGYPPNWVMRMIRYTPPPLQGVLPMTSVNMSASLRVTEEDGSYYLDEAGEWVNGAVLLRFPFASQAYPAPVLSIYVGSVSLPLSGEQILAVGPSGQMAATNVMQEAVVCEYIEDDELFPGGHILLRLSAAPDKWWHVHHPCLKLTGGPMHLFCGGCRQLVNITSIMYSADYLVGEGGYEEYEYGDYNEWTFPVCWPRRWAALPDVAAYDTEVDWTGLNTPADDWTTLYESMDEEPVQTTLGYRPKVRFVPSASGLTSRPVVWLVAQEHAADIEVPTGLPSPEETDGDLLLEGLTLHMDDTWRNATGRATFALDDTAQYPDWLERGLLALEWGWQDGGYDYGAPTWQAQDGGEYYILPGGLQRSRSGDEGAGLARLEVAFGDYVAAVLRSTVAVDMWQAGGMYVADWFAAVGNHLGLTADRLAIDPAIGETVVPTDLIPSRPNLAVQDGMTWEQHLEAVCSVLDLRWGWRAGKLFLDTGPPDYDPEVDEIAVTLSDDTETGEEIISEVTHTPTASSRNAVKVTYGSEAKQRFAYALPTVGQLTIDGAALWVHTDDTAGAQPEELIARAEEEHAARSVIKWRGPGRPGLRPDQFVQVDAIENIEVTAGTVYRITSIDWTLDATALEFDMTVEAESVWTPEGYGS